MKRKYTGGDDPSKKKKVEYKDGDPIINQRDTIYDPKMLQKFPLHNGKGPKYLLRDKSTIYTKKPKEKGVLDYVDDIMSAPQRAAVYALTGKYENPSKALGIDEEKHPWLAMGTDLILDPTNLLGIGSVTKGAGKILEKVAGTSAEHLDDLAKLADRTPLNLHKYETITDFSKYADNYKNLYSSKYKDLYKTFDPGKIKDYKNIITAPISVEEKVTKLSKTGLSLAIINDLIRQTGEYESKDSYKITPVYDDPIVDNKTGITKIPNKLKIQKFVKPIIKEQPIQRAIAHEGQDIPPWREKGAISFEPNTTNLTGGKGQYVYYDNNGYPKIITKDEFERQNKIGTPKFEDGGPIKASRDNTSTKYTPSIDLNIDKKEKIIKDNSYNYINSIIAGVTPADTFIDAGATLYNLKKGKYDNAAANGLGMLIPGISGQLFQQGYEDISDYMKNKNKKYANGGMIPQGMTEINIEKNELLVNPQDGKVMRSYTMQRPHANGNEKEPYENFVIAPEGGIIVPTKWAKAYDKGDKTRRNSILRNLQNQESAKQMKAGGLVSGTDLGANVGPSMQSGQFVKNTGSNINMNSTLGYAGAASNVLGAWTGNQGTNKALNSTVDSVVSAIPVAGQIYGAASGLHDLGKSMVSRDMYGNPTSSKGLRDDLAMSQPHKNAIDQFTGKGPAEGVTGSNFFDGMHALLSPTTFALSSKKANTSDPYKEQQDLMLQTQANNNVVNTLTGLNINKQTDQMNPYKMKDGGRVPSYHSKLVPSYGGGTPRVGDYSDPTGNKDWTYSYGAKGLYGYKDNKEYNLSNDPRYKSSVDLFNSKYDEFQKAGGGGTGAWEKFLNGNKYQTNPNVDYNYRMPSNNISLEVPNTLTNNRPTTNTILGGEDKGFNLNVDPNAIAAGAGVLGNSVGSIYDMIWSRGGKRYDKVNYGQVAPHLISNERALKEVDTSTAYGKENIRKLNSSGGGLLSAYTALAAKRAAAKAGILESTNNQNAGILNQNSQYNKGLEMQSMNDTAQNKARSEDIFRKGLRDTGTNVMYGIKDYQTSKTNNLYMRMLAAKYGNLPQYQEFMKENELLKP